MKHIKLLAVIAAMAICGTVSAQENYFNVSYSNVAIKASAMGVSITQDLNGLSVGVSQARALPGELPFLYEYGADLLMAFGDSKSTLVSAVVPVSLMYRLDLGQIQLIPFAGLNLTAHIIGQSKYDENTPSTGSRRTRTAMPATAFNSVPNSEQKPSTASTSSEYPTSRPSPSSMTIPS